MTDQAGFAFTRATPTRRWTVTMADGSARTVAATACRVDHGCLVFSESAGMTVAMAAGAWLRVEPEPAP